MSRSFWVYQFEKSIKFTPNLQANPGVVYDTNTNALYDLETDTRIAIDTGPDGHFAYHGASNARLPAYYNRQNGRWAVFVWDANSNPFVLYAMTSWLGLVFIGQKVGDFLGSIGIGGAGGPKGFMQLQAGNPAIGHTMYDESHAYYISASDGNTYLLNLGDLNSAGPFNEYSDGFAGAPDQNWIVSAGNQTGTAKYAPSGFTGVGGSFQNGTFTEGYTTLTTAFLNPKYNYFSSTISIMSAYHGQVAILMGWNDTLGPNYSDVYLPNPMSREEFLYRPKLVNYTRPVSVRGQWLA